MKNIVKFYPVGTADCSLIKLDNGYTIIVDCQIKEAVNKDGVQVAFDVKKDLLSELRKDNDGHPYVDLFINTHPHDDHCVGFGEHFFHGAPSDYDDKKDEDKIIVGELWITPRTLGNDLSESAAAIRSEAKRRRKLYNEDGEYKGEYGNYLRVIGYDEDKEYDSRYGYVPGTLVSTINGNDMELLEIFIHAPFKGDVSKCKNEDDKNATSIVAQFGFKNEKDGTVKHRLLMGGDAEHNIWQHILDNNKEEEKLKWNIFLAPHHCSWTFFNDSSNKDEVLSSAEEILKKQIGNNSFIISSSVDILDDDKNPPCYQAKKEYKKRLNTKENFKVTATDNVSDGIPQPIVFRLNAQGVSKVTKEIDGENAKKVGKALKDGGLFVASSGLLSMASTAAHAVVKSGGFYGEDV